MPAYHSAYNEIECEQICGCGVYPIKTAVRGPSPGWTQGEGADIIDETIDFFRANVLFRNFQVQGPADRTLIYLTLFTQQCIKRVERKDKGEAARVLHALAVENFKLPGDAGFPLTGTFPAPGSREEQDKLRALWKQLREELSGRLMDRLYDADGTQNKWWMSFSKRKFMDRQLGH